MVDITGNKQVPFAAAGNDVFDGNGKIIDAGFSVDFNGQVVRKGHTTRTYTVKADCTGTSTYADGAKFDLLIAPDVSMFTFVQVVGSEQMTSGVEERATAKLVAP
jgi:hypothetical protein